MKKKNRSFKKHPRQDRIKSSKYLLPNLITALSVFFGFLAIKLSIDARLFANTIFYTYACYALIAAGICDGLDGSVARLTKSQSSFGVQMDSLADMVSFGVAPSLLVYNFSLYGMNRLGICTAFIFTVCGALRLARFNVQSVKGKASGSFSGLPIPMAAFSLAVYVLMHTELSKWQNDPASSQLELKVAYYITHPKVTQISLTIIVFLLAFAMISSFEYLSHKSLKLPRRKPFRFIALAIMLLAVVLGTQFILSLAVCAILYAIHGPIMWFFTRKNSQFNEEEILESIRDRK